MIKLLSLIIANTSLFLNTYALMKLELKNIILVLSQLMVLPTESYTSYLGRTSAEILGHFKRYSFKVRCQVKTVTVDMNASYASLVKKTIP